MYGYQCKVLQTPPDCKNVADSWKLKHDQGLQSSVMNLDGIFSQHIHLANTSVSPGQSWHYLSGSWGPAGSPGYVNSQYFQYSSLVIFSP